MSWIVVHFMRLQPFHAFPVYTMIYNIQPFGNVRVQAFTTLQDLSNILYMQWKRLEYIYDKRLASP